uniref:Uncharacterized protein n=1 Tax=Arundo donax TaxID=35708 RepID=A0A0A9HLL5_ARUDO
MATCESASTATVSRGPSLLLTCLTFTVVLSFPCLRGNYHPDKAKILSSLDQAFRRTLSRQRPAAKLGDHVGIQQFPGQVRGARRRLQAIGLRGGWRRSEASWHATRR